LHAFMQSTTSVVIGSRSDRVNFKFGYFVIKKKIKIGLKSTPYGLNPMATNVASCVNEKTCNYRESKFIEKTS